MEQSNSASLREDRQKERRPLLALLLLLVLITTSVVGFILGRSAGPEPLGQIIDTILLSPEDPAGTRPKSSFHLTGRVFYSDGTPAAGRVLELHSDPMTTVSDSQGGFLFPNAPEGTHTILVRGNDGSVAAQREIEILRDSAAEAVQVDLREDGAYVIELAVDVRVLEIAIELEGETLHISPERVTYATRDGLVVTEAGSASIQDGAVVSPGGNVYLSDGTIVLPGAAAEDPTYIIRPDDSVVTDQAVSTEGAEVAADGTVTLPDGTEIQPGGQIVTPDNEEHDPGAGGAIVGGGTVTPIGDGSPEISEPPTGGNPPPIGGTDSPTGDGSAGGDGSSDGGGDSSGGASGGGGGGDSGGGDSGGGGGGDSGGGGGGDSGGGDSGGGGGSSGGDTPSSGSLSVYGEAQNGDYVQWTQNSTIDLFFNRAGGAQEKIAPGSSGYYQFRLENTRASRLHIRVALAEGGLHLPLAFTLTPLDAEGKKLSGQAVSGSLSANGGLVLETDIAGDDSAIYRLDWEWPLEGNDAVDTKAGTAEHLVYLLSMTIRAEET